MSRKTSRHRRRLPAITRGQLRRDNRDLRHQLDGAEQFMTGQRQVIAERDDHIAQLETTVARLQADRVDAGVLRQQLNTARATNERLTVKYIKVKARLQDATAITVPPMHRDADGPDEHPTEPIYVQALRDTMTRREAAAAMPQVKPLAEAFGGRV